MIEVLPPEFSEENPADYARRRSTEAREHRPILVGLLGTVVCHLLLLLLVWLTPRWTPAGGVYGEGTAEELGGEKELLIDLAKEDINVPNKATPAALTPEQRQVLMREQVEQRQPNEPRYIDTNPLAADNMPDDAMFESARNQQAAQAEVGSDNSPIGQVIPNTRFKDYTALVSGQGIQDSVSVPPPGQNGRGDEKDQHEIQALIEGTAVIIKAQTPLPGFEKIVGDNPEGIGTSIGAKHSDATDTDKTVEGSKFGTEENLVAVGGTNQVRMVAGAPGKPGPRPRPRIRDAKPAILRDQPLMANRAGEVGADAKLTDYGQWNEEFYEIVSAYFLRHTEANRNYPPTGGYVIIVYRMNLRGEITQIVDVKENVGRQWTYACLDSLQAPSPYRPWTKEMIDLFGEEHEFIAPFRFDY